MLALCLIAISVSVTLAAEDSDYTYDKQREWGGTCNIGRSQSPIDITANNVEATYNYLWKLDFMPTLKVTADHGVHGVTYKVSDDKDNKDIIFMGTDYPIGRSKGLKLLQVHFHWGQDSTHGSEHHLFGIKAAGELHLVTRNLDQSDENALDAFAVFGVFLDVDEDLKEGSELPASALLRKMIFGRNDPDSAPTQIDFSLLYTKENTQFFTYEGSLTTPGCHEWVFWQVFHDPVMIAKDVAKEMRTKRVQGKESTTYTNRDIQNLNKRIITQRILGSEFHNANLEDYGAEFREEDGEDKDKCNGGYRSIVNVLMVLAVFLQTLL